MHGDQRSRGINLVLSDPKLVDQYQSIIPASLNQVLNLETREREESDLDFLTIHGQTHCNSQRVTLAKKRESRIELYTCKKFSRKGLYAYDSN